MDAFKRKELITGGFMLAAGIAYLLATMSLPRKSFIDAAFVPYVLAIFMCGLGVLQLVFGFRNAPAADAPADDKKGEVSEYGTVIKTLALIAAYIATLEPIGFPIVTAIYLYLQFIVLTPHGQKIGHLTYAITAIVSAIVIYLIFRQGFDLMLPSGVLNI
ncbi:tripartite tricarboxylate transporter TctB family protein [Pseudomonas argentinensis]|uniref:Putative tricarboxylic transport membrane protein n=1 Tax=Phytopseudomonas argentinensis TaxID=289370 RepID=A0A1I3M6Z8_9GAMM|nr:tripartite tricarboxylate transporter TctB family protein [Pseudomonas argentinensis]KAB0547017.1 tripartite tricarboxylate transporter TctB family protein [Pseudomonas argentinensis]SFI92600.1 putative tricarboxylic transport membrane protein [Pseudomonas argentinensis]